LVIARPLFKHIDVWCATIHEKHASGEIKAITKETWKQFGKLIMRAKDGDVTKINVENGMWNQTMIDFVSKCIQI